jgi:polysaccharide pyruvyl transferase WcaK-like protein
MDAYRNLKGLDVLIVSGGGQLDDYWAGGGPWSHPYTMLKWGLLAKLHKAKFIFVSVGAGPIDARLSRVFIKWALTLADYRSYRDRFSKSLIQRIGFRRADPVYPDLAFSYQFKKTPLTLEKPNSRPVVGIGPIGFHKPGCWPEQNEAIYAAYLEKMSTFVTWLVGRGYSILFLPGEAYFDQIVIDELKAVLRKVGISCENGQIIERPIRTVGDLIGQIAVTDLVVVSRFHNVLLAQLLGKPVLALSYQAKIDALMADTGQGSFCFPIEQFEVAQLKERFTVLEKDSESVKSQVARRVREYQSALDEQYERIFNGI